MTSSTSTTNLPKLSGEKNSDGMKKLTARQIWDLNFEKMTTMFEGEN